MPGFKSFSDTVATCVNIRNVVKVKGMVMRPRVVRNACTACSTLSSNFLNVLARERFYIYSV